MYVDTIWRESGLRFILTYMVHLNKQGTTVFIRTYNNSFLPLGNIVSIGWQSTVAKSSALGARLPGSKYWFGYFSLTM